MDPPPQAILDALTPFPRARPDRITELTVPQVVAVLTLLNYLGVQWSRCANLASTQPNPH